MTLLALAAFALLALAPFGAARADMYPDMSNAVGGKRAGVFYAPAFGDCAWNATSDVGVCINAALQAAAAAGGGTVIIPAGTYGVSTPIVTSANNVGVACNAPSGTRAASEPYTVPPPVEADGCELKWIGPAGGRIMSFAAPNDSQFLVGAKIENIRFNGNNGLAADALYLRSTHGGTFANLKFVGGFTGGNVIDLDVVPGEHATPHGNQWNDFKDIGIYNWKYTSNGLKLGFYQSANPGSTGANASLNSFDNLHIHTGNGATGKGIWCRGCDNNSFKKAYVSVDTGGVGIDLDIYTDNGAHFAAQGNVFDHVAFGFPGGTALARGQTSYPACIAYGLPGFGNCTWGNEFKRIDGSNGTPPPQIEPGAYVAYGFDYGVSVNSGGAFLAGDGVRPAQTIMRGYEYVQTCGSDAKTYGAGLATHYCFANQPILLFSNAKLAAERSHFTLGMIGAVAGAEDMRWTRPFGTGRYVFGDANVQMDGSAVLGGSGATCAGLGVLGSLCLQNGGAGGLELTDGVANWLVRQNETHEFEVLRLGFSPGIKIANANFPQVWFTGPVTPANAIVASLPACNATTKFSLVAVSDQLGVPTYRGALTGGGGIAALAFCNGTSWEAH